MNPWNKVGLSFETIAKLGKKLGRMPLTTNKNIG